MSLYVVDLEPGRELTWAHTEYWGPTHAPRSYVVLRWTQAYAPALRDASGPVRLEERQARRLTRAMAMDSDDEGLGWLPGMRLWSRPSAQQAVSSRSHTCVHGDDVCDACHDEYERTPGFRRAYARDCPVDDDGMDGVDMPGTHRAAGARRRNRLRRQREREKEE